VINWRVAVLAGVEFLQSLIAVHFSGHEWDLPQQLQGRGKKHSSLCSQKTSVTFKALYDQSQTTGQSSLRMEFLRLHLTDSTTQA